MTTPVERIKVSYRTNPFDLQTRRVTSLPWANQTLAEISEAYVPGVETTIWVNQRPASNTARRARPGDEVVIIPYVGDPITATIAIIGYVSAGMAAGGISGFLWTVGVHAAIGIAGGFIVQALAKTPEGASYSFGSSEGGQSAAKYAWSRHSTQRPGLVVPMSFGRNSHMGNIIAAWTEYSGQAETMKMAISIGGMGPHQGIVTDSERVNDQPLANFNNVTATEKKGTYSQTAGFSSLKLPYAADRIVSADGGPITWTTPGDRYDSLEVRLEYRAMFRNPQGGASNHTIGISVEISPTGLGTWSTLVSDDLINDTTESQFVTYATTGTYTGGAAVSITNGTRYDLRVTKTSADTSEDTYFDDLKIQTVHEVVDTGFVYPGQHIVYVEALATDQLSGGLSFRCVSDDLIIDTYDGAVWTLQHSSNPAWVIWHLLTQPVIAGDGSGTAYNVTRYDGVDPSKLTPYLADWFVAAEYFDELVDDGNGSTEANISFNGSFDSGTNIWDAVTDVCKASRCELIPQGTGFLLLVDKAETDEPIQMFSAGNIIPGTYRRPYLTRAELVSEFQLDFRNKYLDYELTPVTDPVENINSVPNVAVLSGFGITSPSQAWRTKEWVSRRNRYIKSECQFETTMDALNCQRGDIIYVAAPWRQDGRVVDSPASNQVTLDAPKTASAGDTLLIRTHGQTSDEVERHTVSAVNGAVITIVGNFVVRPSENDVYVFGPTDRVLQKWRVNQIIEQADLRAKITATEYHSELYDGDATTPAIDSSSFVAPVTAPNRTRPVTKYDLTRIAPQSMLGPPALDAPMITDVVFSDDIGNSRLTFTAGILTYKGVTYDIVSGATSTGRYVYWDQADTPTVFQDDDDLSVATGVDKFVVALNVSGVTRLVGAGRPIDGSSILDDTVLTSAFSVEKLSAISAYLGDVQTGTLTGTTITGGIIRTATSGRRMVMTGDGVTLYSGQTSVGIIGTTGNGGSNVLIGTTGNGGSGLTVGDGQIGSINNANNGIPIYINQSQTVADIHLPDRVSTPSGLAEIGDLSVVGGILKICTAAGTPGTWTTVGTQT